MFGVTFEIHMKPWLSDPRKRWNAGLEGAGFNFRVGLSRSHYPPIPPDSRYARTYATADKAGFRITEPGRVMEFGSTFYLPFLLFGTRRWQGWPGKSKELIKLMSAGFKGGIRDFKDE